MVFNSKAEWDEPPKTLYGQEILKLVDGINYKSGKHRGSKRKHDDCDDDIDKLFKRKSIFFIYSLATFISSPCIRCDAH